MENLFRPPDPLVLDDNIAENWRRFEQKFDVFLTATDLQSKPEQKKIAVFLNLIGDDGLELYNSFTFTEEDRASLEAVKKKLEGYCAPTANVIFERFKFNSLFQKEMQPFDSFLTDIRKAVKTTGYKDPDEMLRDRIVMGVFDKTTQERLLRETKLTLNKAIEFCRATEVSKTQSKALQIQSEAAVSAIQGSSMRSESYVKNKFKNKNLRRSQPMCSYCGYEHNKTEKYPAFGTTCAHCQGRNHFAAVCKVCRVKLEVI